MADMDVDIPAPSGTVEKTKNDEKEGKKRFEVKKVRARSSQLVWVNDS